MTLTATSARALLAGLALTAALPALAQDTAPAAAPAPAPAAPKEPVKFEAD